MLVDLKSRNGRFVNGKRIETGAARDRRRGPPGHGAPRSTRSTTRPRHDRRRPAASRVRSPFSTEEPLPEIQPFAGIRYRVPDADLTKVLAPPYDVIPPVVPGRAVRARPAQHRARGAQPRAGRRGLPRRRRDLRAAGWTRACWPRTTQPALYLLEQAFTAEGATLARLGLLARFRAEDAAAGQVLPHEHTRAAAKEDRYKLLQATRANFSPIFLMFRGPGGPLRARAGGRDRRARRVATYTDDGGRRAPPVARHRRARHRGLPGRRWAAEGVHRGRPPPLRDRAALSRRGRRRTARGRSATSRRWTRPACWSCRTTASWPRARRSPRRARSFWAPSCVNDVRGRGLRRARGRAVHHALRVRPGRAGRAGARGGGAAGGRGPAARRTRRRACARSTLLPAPGRAAALLGARRRRRALRALAGGGRGGARPRHAAGWPCCCARRRCGRSWTWPRRGSRCPPRARSSTPSCPSGLVIHPLLA